MSSKKAQISKDTHCVEEGSGASTRFLDLARKLAAIPKPEYDKEAAAVENGKPLRPLPRPTR